MLPVTAAGPKYAQCDVMSLLDHRGDMRSGRRGVCRAPRRMGRMGASGHCRGTWGDLAMILSVTRESGVLIGTMGHPGGHGRVKSWDHRVIHDLRVNCTLGQTSVKERLEIGWHFVSTLS